MSDARLPPSEGAAGPAAPGGVRAVRRCAALSPRGWGQPWARAQPCPAHRPQRTESDTAAPAAAPAAPHPGTPGLGAPRPWPPQRAQFLPKQSQPRCPYHVPSHYGKRPRALKTKLRWSQQFHPAEHEHVCIHSHPAGPGLRLCAHYVTGDLNHGPEWKIRLCCRIYNSFSILHFVC